MNTPVTTDRFVPWDIAIARYNFGANCGPIAFAAALKMEVCDAMQFFPHFAFENRRWTNSVQMLAALAEVGIAAERIKQSFPETGLALVQWLGPWTSRDFFSRDSLRYTHWVAIEEEYIFDPNAAQWMTLTAWSERFAPACIGEIPKASDWSVKYGFSTISSQVICPSMSDGREMGRSVTGPNSRFNFRPRTF